MIVYERKYNRKYRGLEFLNSDFIIEIEDYSFQLIHVFRSYSRLDIRVFPNPKVYNRINPKDLPMEAKKKLTAREIVALKLNTETNSIETYDIQK